MSGPERAPFRGFERDAWRPLPVALEAFDILRETLLALAGDTEAVRMALLACDEWIANVVSYSGATAFAFAVQPEGSRLWIGFRDNGIPFDPTAEKEQCAEFEDFDMGGMGLGLIRQTALEMNYRLADGWNVLTLAFDIAGEGAAP